MARRSTARIEAQVPDLANDNTQRTMERVERVETGLADLVHDSRLLSTFERMLSAARDAAKSAGGAPAPTQESTRMALQAVPAATPNTITFNDLMTVAQQLGEDAGKGKDVQIKFMLKIAEAAFHGSIDLDANKHGAETDDATKLTETYVKAQSGATIFDAKAPNQRKTISTTRTMIKLGMWPKGGPGEPLSTLNTLISMRQKLRQDPANSKRLDDAANTALRYARTQIKRDQVLDDAELRAFCFKPSRDARTGEEIVESVRKLMSNLKAGKVANCPDLDNSQEVQDIIRLCTKRLTTIAKSKGGQAAGAATPKVAAAV